MNKKRKVSGAELQTKRFSMAMITPTIIVLAVMTAYPLIFTLVYSFTDYNLLSALNSAPEVTGFKNYIDLLSDSYFQQSVWNTVKFTLLTVVLEMLVGFGLALFVNSLKKGQKVMRTLLLLPYLLPTVTVALIWRMMLSPNYGIVNQVLVALPKGTNTEKPNIQPKNTEDTWMTARNKWLLAHAESSEAAGGAYVGLTGENIDIAKFI